MAYDFTSNIAKLRKALDCGIPSCYQDDPIGGRAVDEFVLDWCMDLPWSPDQCQDAAMRILGSAEALAVVREFDAKHYADNAEDSLETCLRDYAYLS